MTPWAKDVSPKNAHPEYPRPQMVRGRWLNLNGVWQFANAIADQAPPFGQTLAEVILVPFPVESALSGIMRDGPVRMWYRRTFIVPSDWAGQRVLLNFGAVDWEATVYVNQVNVGTHRGGYSSFSFDITSQLNGGTNELIVGVFDPTDAGNQPVGKQRRDPRRIWYTSTSGIWQTVWLEPVPTASITRLDMTPDVLGAALRLTVQAVGVTGETVEAVAWSGGGRVGVATGKTGTEIRVPVPKAHLWSPDDPFLYNLQVSLKRGPATVDVVKSYFGMRSIGLATVGGALRPVLNGQFVFQIGTLDQGFWPDGVYTAPTDAALRFDLEQHKVLGFNTVRKHVKVEPARWYYWADKLGLLVWQDIPSMTTGRIPSPAARQQFEAEMQEIIDEHRSFTSIIQWVVFNEGWGQYDQARLADLVKSWDPSRLVDNMSGVNCCGSVDGDNGDVVDWHVYIGPRSPYSSRWRAAVLGEFGGLGVRIADHLWNPEMPFAYRMLPDGTALTNQYWGLIQQTQLLMRDPGLSAAIYTQITDVENEVNGMLTYDRLVMKPDAKAINAVNQYLTDPGKQMTGAFAINKLQSLQVTTPGLTDRFIRPLDSLGLTELVDATSSGSLKQDATFRVVAGLADASCYSFESRSFPGHYLRHFKLRLRSDPRDGSVSFDQEATFCSRRALDGSSNFSLESKNIPGYYVRHRSDELWLDPFEDAVRYREDATWSLATPWWRSGAEVPVDAYHSFEVSTKELTDRYIRHFNGLCYTEVVDSTSDKTLRQDATFRIVPGFADDSCYSFESRNFPGQYLRHSSHRLRKDQPDGSALFNQDATFCAQPGLSGSGVSFQSFNYPEHYIRHFNSEVWIASDGGPDAFDSQVSYGADATWNVVAPWGPPSEHRLPRLKKR